MTPTTSTRSRQSNMSAEEYVDHLSNQGLVVQKLISTIQQSVTDGDIESWQYPDIEIGLGYFTAAVFGSLSTGMPFPSDS